MSLFDIHIFVCENQRDPDDPRGCCAEKGGAEFRTTLKKMVKSRNLDLNIRVNKAGCLDTCAQGISMVIYPRGIWYGKVQISDIPEILDETILKGKKIERLLMPFQKSKNTRVIDIK